ncbi:MAG TPA: hypothetical protein VES59_04895 [Bacteroidota bacterium]|nr:hypothetical protein [Bacteroidota bacterium]
MKPLLSLTSGYRIIVCSVLLIPTLLMAGEWSTALGVPGLPTVQFRWRLVDYDVNARRNRIEWSFANESDSIVTLRYKVTSERNEPQFGIVTLAPHHRKLAGWLFEGMSINVTQVNQANLPPGADGKTQSK